MKFIMDAHMHSKASDGLWTPSEVVEQAKLRGLEVIALTDHDTTSGIKEAVKRGNELGLRVIPGIEIDADFLSGKVKVDDIELLGLGIDTTTLQPFVEKRFEQRLGSLKAYINEFNAYITSPDFIKRNDTMKYKLDRTEPLSVDKIKAWRTRLDNYDNPFPFLSRTDITKYLLENFASRTEPVEKALQGDKSCIRACKEEYMFLFEGREEKPTFYEAIDEVKKAKGKAVLAHPGLSKGYKGGMIKEWEKPESEWYAESADFTPFKFISDLVDHGLDGLEMYYYKLNDPPHADMQDRINLYFRKIADRLGLMITYGSDCHGPKGKGPLMGLYGSEKLFL